MGGDTVVAKPSVHFTEWRGVCISGVLIILSIIMEIAFRTERIVCIIVDGHISGVSGRRRSTVVPDCNKIHSHSE